MLGSCPDFALQLPIDYNVDENVFVVLRDDGTYSKGTYTDPSTDTANRKCKCNFDADGNSVGLLQGFFWDNTEGYVWFDEIDAFLNGVKKAWQKCKFEFAIDSREATFTYKISVTMELTQ